MRAYGYIRVSKETKGQVSPAVQQDAIAEEAEKRGWEIAEWFQDIDQSATRFRPMELPAFGRMVRQIEAGGADAILFYRIDRAVREHTGEFDVIESRLKRAGITLGYTNRQYDDTPEGQFALDLDKALSRLETRRLGARFRDMHARLAREGKYAGNFAAFGWTLTRDPDGQQRMALNPDEAPWREKMHEWYQSGWALRQIAAELNRQGVPTKRGGPWVSSTIKAMLGKPMQIGARVTAQGEFVTGRIEPLINRETFERTLALLEARRGTMKPGRPSKRPIPSGLLVCGTCGSPLYAARTARSNREGVLVYYQCSARRAGGICNQGVTIRESVLLREVEPLLLARLRQMSVRVPQGKPSPQIAPLRAERETIEISIARLAGLYTEGGLSEPEYQRSIEMQRRKLGRVTDRLNRAIAEVERTTLRTALGPVAFSQELWNIMPAGARQEIYQLAIERIIVNPRTKAPRLQVVWR